MKKRVISMLLTLCLLIPCCLIPAWAVEGEDIMSAEQMLDTYDYQVESNTDMSWPVTESWFGGYRVLFQNVPAYRSIPYGQGTIFASACGPSAMSNVLFAAGLADIDIPTMCDIAVECGARVTGGTNEATLLKALAPQYNFTYKSTSNSKDLKAHLESGGYALVHAGTSYPIFTSNGHYMAAVDIEGDTVTLLDSYWQSDKYTRTQAKRDNVTVAADGIIKVSLSQIAKACADRSPSYFLLYKKSSKPSAADKGDAPFTDIFEGDWYYNFVVDAYKAGLMTGTSKTKFEPNKKLTRAMAAQILYTYAGSPAVTQTSPFADVKEKHWFSQAVIWAAEQGIIAGYGNQKFGPNDNVTREQLALMLYGAEGHSDIEIPDDTGILETQNPDVLDSLDYSDASKISNWAVNAVIWATEQGIISGTTDKGKTILDPKGSASRAQAATMMLKFIQRTSEVK